MRAMSRRSLCCHAMPSCALPCCAMSCCAVLPLQACLTGPEVQLTLPLDEDLAGVPSAAAAGAAGGSTAAGSSTSMPGSTGSSASTSWGPASSLYTVPAVSGGSVATGSSDIDRRPAAVVVFEGQRLSWTLTLTNISCQPITGCKVRYCGAGQQPRATSTSRCAGFDRCGGKARYGTPSPT